MAARFKMRALRRVFVSAVLGFDDVAARSDSSIGKASISVTVGLIVKGASRGAVICR